MTRCKPDNQIVNKFFYVLLQVLFIFLFLTIFFFAYIHPAEKAVSKTQINIVVDDLSLDMNVRPLVPKGQEDIATILISDALDLEKKNVMKSTSEDDKRIEEQNDKIMKEAFMWVGISSSVLLMVSLCIYLSGYCLPFHIHIKEALIVVFFFALIELVFFLIIIRKYWSVDPSEIRQTLGDAIQDYIKKHHPQNN